MHANINTFKHACKQTNLRSYTHTYTQAAASHLRLALTCLSCIAVYVSKKCMCVMYCCNMTAPYIHTGKQQQAVFSHMAPGPCRERCKRYHRGSCRNFSSYSPVSHTSCSASISPFTLSRSRARKKRGRAPRPPQEGQRNTRVIVLSRFGERGKRYIGLRPHLVTVGAKSILSRLSS